MKKVIFEFLQFLLPPALIVLLPIPDILKYIFIAIWGFIIIWWLDGKEGNESLIQFLKKRLILYRKTSKRKWIMLKLWWSGVRRKARFWAFTRAFPKLPGTEGSA